MKWSDNYFNKRSKINILKETPFIKYISQTALVVSEQKKPKETKSKGLAPIVFK